MILKTIIKEISCFQIKKVLFYGSCSIKRGLKRNPGFPLQFQDRNKNSTDKFFSMVYPKQGVPINMGIKWRLLSSLFPCGIIFAVSQFKPKTTSLGVSKLWSTIFLPSKLTEILEICQDSSLLKINKTVQMFNISVNFKDTKKVDHILVSSLDV